MKIMPLLKKEIKKSIILEFSDKLVQKLIQKFQQETKDDVDVILSYISDFEKFKEGLNPEERNIEKLSYEQLKNIVSPKRTKSNITKYLKHFKKTTEGVANIDLIKAIRKFLELEKYLDPRSKDITKLKYLDLVGFLEKNFEKAMTKILTDKLSSQTQLSKDQISYYITTYFNILNNIPIDSKLVTDMTGDEFEHFIDGLTETSEVEVKPSEDIKNIELLYDKDNLKIFAPKTKDQCILLRNGRSWCTSRDGSSNLYYNYRLNNNLTLYYIINEDLPFSDVNFASVILVQTNGKVRLADGTNSGKYSGHDTVSWDDIYKKIPKLRGLENLFVSKPLTEEEKRIIDTIKKTRVGDNPMESFDGDEKMVEMWLEILSPNLTDIQYINISDDLKKKFISLGFSLSPKMIENTSSKVMDYYIRKKIDSIQNKTVDQLNDSDIALLRIPAMSKIKDSLKSKFASSITTGGKKLEIDGLTSGAAGKYIALFGLETLIENLPENLEEFKVKHKGSGGFILEIPNSIGRFKNLNMLLFDNCIDSVPDVICALPKLRFLSLMNNETLRSIPECVSELPNLLFLNLKGSNNVTVPQSISSKGTDMGGGYWDMGGND